MKKKTTQLIETSSWILLILFPLAFICFLGYVMLTHKPSPGSSIGTGDIIMVFVMGAAIAEAILFLIWRMVRKMRIKNEWERPLDVFLVFCGSHRIAVIIISLLVLFLLTLVGVYWVQDKMLFYPDDGIFDGAELENDDEVSTFLLEKKYHGFYKQNGARILLVFYGGNAQSGASAMKVFRRIGNRNLFSDIDIITVDYPGYGRSEGAPSQQSFFEMADAVNRYALSLSEYQKVYVMGYSIGTGVAVYSAASYSFDGIILLAPYDNMTNVFNSKLPVFYGPLARLVKNPFPSDSYASNVKAKTLILYSTKDEIIPARLSRNLIQTIAGDKEVIEFKNFTHSEMIVEKEVYEKVSDFIHK